MVYIGQRQKKTVSLIYYNGTWYVYGPFFKQREYVGADVIICLDEKGEPRIADCGLTLEELERGTY